jgi:hypothetical protein
MFGFTSPAKFAPAQGCLFFICLLLCISTARANEIGTYKDWSAFREGPRERTVCYIGSIPEKEEGKYKLRGDPYILITHRPAENLYGVFSVTAGYEYKIGSHPLVEIDNQHFTLFTEGENAWMPEGAEMVEAELIKAMQRGNKMIVRGTSRRGTLTTDTYSLSGFTAALTAIDKACRKG